LVRPWLYWFPASLPFLGLGTTRFDPEFPICRMSGLQAGLLARWASRLDRANAARRRASVWFERRFRAARPTAQAAAHLRFPLLAGSRDARDRLCTASRRLGLGLTAMYPGPVTEIEALPEAARRIPVPGAAFL